MKDSDYAALEDSLNELLWDLLYKPLVAEVKKILHRDSEEDLPTLENATDNALRRALKTGKVQMVEDTEKGRAVFEVSGAPGKEVASSLRAFAKYNRTLGSYVCKLTDVPDWVKAAARSYGVRSKEAHSKMLRMLQDIEDGIDKQIESRSLKPAAGKAVKAAHDSWKDAAKPLQIQVELDEAGQKSLEESLEANAKIPIKDFAHEAIARLREEVEDNAVQGYRAEGLAKRVTSEYGMSKARANLIAIQETSNFMAATRKARAKDAGIERYVWMCSLDGRERADHRKLHGTTQSYDNPPIVDSRTGKRGNPGTDFRCRCLDMPIVS